MTNTSHDGQASGSTAAHVLSLICLSGSRANAHLLSLAQLLDELKRRDMAPLLLLQGYRQVVQPPLQLPDSAILGKQQAS